MGNINRSRRYLRQQAIFNYPGYRLRSLIISSHPLSLTMKDYWNLMDLGPPSVCAGRRGNFDELVRSEQILVDQVRRPIYAQIQNLIILFMLIFQAE